MIIEWEKFRTHQYACPFVHADLFEGSTAVHVDGVDLSGHQHVADVRVVADKQELGDCRLH